MYFAKVGAADITCRSSKKLFSQASGERVGTRRRVNAEFEKGVPLWALDQVLEVFPRAVDQKPEGMPVERWLCWYDSQWDQQVKGWTDEERELIEEKLSGRWGVTKIEPVRVKPPYPKYDAHRKTKGQRTIEHVVRDIQATFESAGFDVGVAVAYERQNLNDPEVIRALEGLEEPEVVEEELVAK